MIVPSSTQFEISIAKIWHTLQIREPQVISRYHRKNRNYGRCDAIRSNNVCARSLGPGGDHERADTIKLTNDRSKLDKRIMREISKLHTANEVKILLAEQLPSVHSVNEDECLSVLQTCISAGNYGLLVSIFSEMVSPRHAVGQTTSSLDWESGRCEELEFVWPKAKIGLTIDLIKALCRNLDTKNALKILDMLRQGGIEATEDIRFGFVVECPDGSGRPLALMQPQEGSKIVADSFSKYEYDVFSGTVVKAESESLVSSVPWVRQALGERIGRYSAIAMHTANIQTPSGQQRVFKFGTASADAPCKLGDRVTMVCAPEAGKTTRREIRYQGPLAPSLPGRRPGEPLSVTNHTIGETTALLRPPKIDSSLVPGWLVASVLVLVGADAASSLVDPVLPYLIAGAAVSTTISVAVTTNVILPMVKQLPDKALSIQVTRQKLLKEHVILTTKIEKITEEASTDIRVLARLWQLLSKMVSVGAQKTYSARMERVEKAKQVVEERLAKRIEMIEEYAKVLNMIEIEVEMETEVPAAEYEGIQEELLRLSEIEELQEQWRIQIEAQDEVERLLQSYSADE